MQDNTLYDPKTGERKYLNVEERAAFKKAALYAKADARTMAMMVYYTGCRIGEALEITPARLTFDTKRVKIRTLKQKLKLDDKGEPIVKYRRIELPDEYLADLESIYRAKSRQGTKTEHKPLWNYTIRAAQKYIKAIMTDAGIEGKRATARGLRHSMGVNLAINKVPLHLIADILGHSSLSNTRIYTQILGEDRRKIISSVW